MNKFILGFSGARDSGKTSALKQLIKLLYTEKYPIKNLSGSNEQDLTVYLDNYQDIRLGIATDGDNYKGVSKNLDLLINKEKCNFIITACRTSGGTHDAINAYKKEGYDIHYITCPYLYIADNIQPEEQLRLLSKIDVSKAILIKTYVDRFLDDKKTLKDKTLEHPDLRRTVVK